MIVAIPKTAVENGGEALVPLVFEGFAVCAVYDALYGLLIAFHHCVYILWSSCPALNFHYPHASVHHLVNKAYGFEVFWTHDILVVHSQFVACLGICYHITAAAYLYTLAAVGRASGIGQTQIAFPAYGHT